MEVEINLMAVVNFHRLARREVKLVEEYDLARDERTAARFREAVDQAWRRIATNPTALAVWKGPFRYIRIKRFPYILYFLRGRCGPSHGSRRCTHQPSTRLLEKQNVIDMICAYSPVPADC